MSGRYQTYTLNSPTIEDPYYLVVQTGDGKIRFGGFERGPDELPRDTFAVQLPGRILMYGEWAQKFASNGNDFDVEIISFGFPPLYSVAGPEGLGCGDNSYLSQSMMLASFTKPRKLAASLS